MYSVIIITLLFIVAHGDKFTMWYHRYSIVCPQQFRNRLQIGIVSNPPYSAFFVLQLGYELKKNGEQNTEQARRMADNFYP